MALNRTNSIQNLQRFSSPEEIVTALHHELDAIKAACKKDDPDMDRAAEDFIVLFEQYLHEKGDCIDWGKIRPPAADRIIPHRNLPAIREDTTADMLGKLAVLKLNGGLGTSMGCVGPKSAISVRDDLSFLDLCVRQIEHLNDQHEVRVPLVLMNSFNTHVDTQMILRKYKHKNVEIRTFNQSKFPRIYKETLQPLPVDASDSTEWYPPGHGDLYRSLMESGELDKLLDSGKEWLFVSNIDNLGATVDPAMLQFLHEKPDCEFVMEVTDKTQADVKGGTLIEYDDRIRLLEVAQVPKEFVSLAATPTVCGVYTRMSSVIKNNCVTAINAISHAHVFFCLLCPFPPFFLLPFLASCRFTQTYPNLLKSHRLKSSRA
eukprot:m.51267 g.51267  ORF g.51267 m.51267 type:complete len:375 (+) comp11227_c0_seq7:1075-2199(+)